MIQVPLYIDGGHRAASDSKTFTVLNPFSKEVVAVSSSASSNDCNDAIDAAARAFVTWENVLPADKRRIFLRAAELLQTDKYRAKVAQTITLETAAVKEMVAMNMAGALANLYEAASLASQIKGETFPSQAPGGHVIVQRRAIGVILSIAPWNAPLGLSFRAAAVPLICGNTVVLKSSECSPASQAIVAELLEEAGLPKGVFNYVSICREDSPHLTAEMIGNPQVRAINFTGSDRVGKIIAGEAAKYLKPCVFELGGKAPAVVLADANLQDAARAIISGAMLHSGQICMSTERVIVQRTIVEAFTTLLKELASSLKAGDPSTDSSARLGSLFTDASAENVASTIAEAKAAGAQIMLGNGTSSGGLMQPHIIVGAQPGMRAWDRESFGPVVAVAVADTVDMAVELANATSYSLTASLWTESLHLAMEVAPRIRSGAVMVNGSTVHSEPSLGHAGLGGATGYGRFDIDNFTQKRMIVFCPPNRVYPLMEHV